MTEKSTALSAANSTYSRSIWATAADQDRCREGLQRLGDQRQRMIMKGKPRGSRRMGRKVSKAIDWKKAVVTPIAEDKIELFEGV